ncbi:MAG TPA: sugar phosphate isomerase/epimerase, partial [Steroidobacteraceae bacterium]|nr:sugar phosphate isomerase/epimerase [Steroidobacteraceae bacterium]
MSRVELLASYWTICGGAEPHTPQEWSPFGLRERAETASKAGFTGLGIWHAALLHLRERHGLAEMRRILADNGIRHLELEFLTDWFLPPGERRTASDQLRQSLLEAAGELGARHVKVGDFFDSPVAMPQLIEEFAKLCREAANHGTRVVFELMPFSVIDNLEDALALVQGADQRNGGICIDLWHVVKLGIPYERVAAAQRHVASIEINDGYLKTPPGMTLHEETIGHRQFCGEGEFDVRGFVDQMV